MVAPGGIAAFDELHSRRRLGEAFLWAFELLELNGADLRPLPFSKRKARLVRLLARARGGIALNDHIEADGAAVFTQACRLGLEGIVSKWLDAPYRSGRSGDWIKTKNPDSPAMQRAREGRLLPSSGRTQKSFHKPGWEGRSVPEGIEGQKKPQP